MDWRDRIRRMRLEDGNGDEDEDDVLPAHPNIA